MAGNNPDGLDMSNKNRNNNKNNQSPGWSVSLVIGDYPARFGEHLFTTIQGEQSGKRFIRCSMLRPKC